ncbi:hypothetical protein [Halobacillus salinus]|uniref:hypothetical protein n=1 Tax=Halobacillus salinus TaxID=192814 RepID=UPI0009A77BBA|nr:hypothetical protein [Halobacillus salinus]
MKWLVIIGAFLTGFLFLSLNMLYNSGPPKPYIVVGDDEIPSTEGSYCWDSGASSKCEDKVFRDAFEMAAQHEPTSVREGEEIEVKFTPFPDEFQLVQWKEGGERKQVVVKDGNIYAPEQPGLYVFQIHAEWEQGDATYAFSVKVSS